jgi:hypothetical protein
MEPLRVGDVLVGFCGGAFGSDSFEDKRVEGIGADWVVARNLSNDQPEFAEAPWGSPASLVEYRR